VKPTCGYSACIIGLNCGLRRVCVMGLQDMLGKKRPTAMDYRCGI
jgi:hypothetical protein